MPSGLLHSTWRALAAAVVGAVAGAACLVIAFTRHPDFSWEMDRPLPGLASGFYMVELNGDDTYAWTSPVAEITLQGLDRQVPWLCTVRVRGARPRGIPQPDVAVAIDGMTLATHTATNTYADLELTAPPRPSRPGLILTIASSATFVPGPSDRRELGVQVDRVSCRPRGPGFARPPRRAIVTAIRTGVVFGSAFGLIGLTVPMTLVGTLLLAVAQAFPLSIASGIYGSYLGVPVWLAFWIVTPTMVGLWLIQRWRREPLHQTARFAAAFSAGVLFVKLLVLLHPSKPLIDALFHAHRLEWVMAGRYYFTQPMPDGVQFPYAIGLYLFAAPWSLFTRDHVALLRIVVCAAETVAGLCLYPTIARTWGARPTAAAAVVLFHLIPVSYVVAGNANLTYAFSQSAAVVTMFAAAAWPLRTGDIGQLAGLFALASLTFLSHVGTFPPACVALLALAMFYRLLGGPALRAPARGVFLAATFAAVFSIVSYYGHFDEAYKKLQRVGAPSTAAIFGSDASEVENDAVAAGVAKRTTLPLRDRVTRALSIAIRNIGWPILVLAIVGMWRTWISGARDRLGLALSAWGVAYIAFLAFALFVPVDLRFQRYADEFVGRVHYAAAPAAVILAARGADWAWSAGLVTRAASIVLWLAAIIAAAQHMVAWL